MENIVQDNQVSSSGQENSPPPENNVEMLKEDLEVVGNLDLPLDEIDVSNADVTNKIQPELEKQQNKNLNDPNATFICELCHTEPKKLQTYFLHLILFHHEKELCEYLEVNPKIQKNYMCPMCKKTMSSNNHQEYLIHYFMGHDQEFVMRLQEKSVRKSKETSIIIKPAIIDDGQKQCPICNFYFPNEIALNNHIKSKHETNICEICKSDAKFTEAGFVQHLLFEHFRHVHDQLQNIKYPSDCKGCNILLTDFQAALDHVVEKHEVLKLLYNNKIKEIQAEELKKKPEKAAMIVQNTNVTVAKKEEISSEVKEHYECNICRVKFGQKVKYDKIGELRSHLAVTHFKDLLLKELKDQLEKFPLCPFKNCPSMFNNQNLGKYSCSTKTLKTIFYKVDLEISNNPKI